jgi:hypothetical protein
VRVPVDAFRVADDDWLGNFRPENLRLFFFFAFVPFFYLVLPGIALCYSRVSFFIFNVYLFHSSFRNGLLTLRF